MTLIERINKFINAVASDIKSLYANKVNKTDVIAIAQGGTGAATATQARKNIGTIEYVASLPAIPEANKFYAVKNGNNIDLYMSDSAGTLFYKFTTSQQTINGLSIGDIITQLFANNEQGFAFDFNDLSTMYQDAAGTIPVTGVGQPVGRVLDKSGCGNHASQSTSAKRPILQQNATTGAYYLAFDGVDDCLVTSNINFNGQNNLSLFASIIFNNLSSTSQAIAELSTASWQTQGTFSLIRGYSGTNSYALRRNFSTNGAFEDLVSQNNTNTKAVLTGIINSTTSEEYMRNFGTLIGSKALTASSNSFKNYPLYIGIGEVTRYPLNGNLYSLIGVARIASTAEITNIEKIIARNIGVDV